MHIKAWSRVIQTFISLLCEKFIFIQQWLAQNMWYIGATIYIFSNKLQKISFKFFFIQNNEKKLKEKSQSFCKVIPLAPLIVFTPNFKMIITFSWMENVLKHNK
jgi:hypothetical protein